MKLRSLITKVRQSRAGFSIIEATIGMGVVGTVTMALFSGFTSGFFTMQMARENQRATQIMLEKTETIRLYSWDQINTSGFIPTTFTAAYDPQNTNSPGVTYTGALKIEDAGVTASYSNDLKKVTVTLNWQTGSINRERSFSSFIARDGLQSYIY